MRKTIAGVGMFLLVSVFAVTAQEAAHQGDHAAAPAKSDASARAKIREAMRAAPPEIAMKATIMDWPEKEGMPMKQLRAGTNGWTCMPSTPTQFGSSALADPMCLDKSFSDWADAWMKKKDPEAKTVGVAYMLKGDKGASNTDPFATGPTATNEWIVSPPHVMVMVPNPSQLDVYPTDPKNGGPWVMWKGTKYAHLMVPIASMSRAAAASKTAGAGTESRAK